MSQYLAEYLTEYFTVIVFIVLSIGVAGGMMVFSLIVSPKEAYEEKMSSYECGLEPFDDARIRFNIQFYLVAMLFILFDLEGMMILPWAVTLKSQPLIGFWSAILFLAELVIAYAYAWRRGALKWS